MIWLNFTWKVATDLPVPRHLRLEDQVHGVYCQTKYIILRTYAFSSKMLNPKYVSILGFFFAKFAIGYLVLETENFLLFTDRKSEPFLRPDAKDHSNDLTIFFLLFF